MLGDFCLNKLDSVTTTASGIWVTKSPRSFVLASNYCIVFVQLRTFIKYGIPTAIGMQ